MTDSITITNKFDEEITITVGCTVEFKCDVEQCGIVKRIFRSRTMAGGWELELECPYGEGFDGDYIGGDMTTTEFAEDCTL